MDEIKTAVLVSGSGTNLQALINAKASGALPHANICLVISSKGGAFALERAKNAPFEIETLTVNRKDYDTAAEFDSTLLNALKSRGIHVIVLAGFMSILGESIIEAYEKSIINVHPSLIPSFCGHGFYGLRVHSAALEKGVKVTGATVHYVNEIPDDGEIILQKAVEVEHGDTPETLQQRVMQNAEHIILPQALHMVTCAKLNCRP